MTHELQLNSRMWRKCIFRVQEVVGLTEKECRACLLLSLLLLVGAAVRYIPKSPILFDDAYYAELDAEFNRLTARADSFDRALFDPRQEMNLDAQESPDSDAINLNTATRTQLEQLPRIGPAIAGRIIRLRERLGKFMDVSDLLMVQGIGEKTLHGIRHAVTLRDTTQTKDSTTENSGGPAAEDAY